MLFRTTGAGAFVSPVAPLAVLDSTVLLRRWGKRTPNGDLLHAE
jgi:hypothetical protein